MKTKKRVMCAALGMLWTFACFAPAMAAEGPHYWVTANVRTAAEFVQAAENPETDEIVLWDDIVLEVPVEMKDNSTLTIDGKGYTLTSTVEGPIFQAWGKNAGVSLRDVQYEGGPICDFPEGQFYLDRDTRVKAWGTIARARYVNFFDDVEIEYIAKEEQPAPMFILTASEKDTRAWWGFNLGANISVFIDNLTTAPMLYVESPGAMVLLAVNSHLDYVGEGAFFAGEALGELFIGFGASLKADVAEPEGPLVSVARRLELGFNAKLLLSSPEAADASTLLAVDEGCYVKIKESAEVVPPLTGR